MASAQTTSLLITALGGALGALILRSALKLIGALWSRAKPLAVHQCESSGSNPGEFDHCWGHAVEDKECDSKMAWEHNWISVYPKPPHHPMGEHTLYGPYINDFGKPGFYRVRFRVRAKHIPKTEKPVFTFDVVQASFGTEKILRLLGQRIVKANELTGSYQNIDVEFYAAGTDVYEYRCAVFPYNEKELANTKVREIRFDCVKVYAHPSIWEIF